MSSNESCASETLDELKARHRKEDKESVSQITALKKQIKSSDKTAKKRIQEQMYNLTEELKKRHEQELLHFDNRRIETAPTHENLDLSLSTNNEENTGIDRLNENLESLNIKNDGGNTGGGGGGGKQRQKKRKEKKQKELERLALEAEEEARGMEDKNKIELELINQNLKPLNLQVHSIKPDGHCLYNSIKDQLLLTKGEFLTVQQLRQLAADYMLGNEQDFLPFMINEETGECFDQSEYAKHCNSIANTALWGGQNEITALVNSLNVSVHVYQAATKQPLKITPSSGSEGSATLNICYQLHAFGLGEHYNSLRSTL